MVRTLLLSLALLLTLRLNADTLDGRLRLLFPGEEAGTVTDRQYFEKGLENIFRQLRYTDRADRKNTRKRLALIRGRFTRQVFRQYDPSATLTDGFRHGTYNDATASVLLALALEEFSIPYESYVDHWECYLVADPAQSHTALRHPGARPHDPEAELRYRREYVNLVRQTIGEDLGELSPEAADSVFYRYYYRPGRSLNFLQLSAYQQLRLAQTAYANGHFAEVGETLREASLRENRRAFLVLARAGELQLSSLEQPEVEGYVTSLFEFWQEEPGNDYLAAALLRHFDTRQQVFLAADDPDGARRFLKDYLRRAPDGLEKWAGELQVLQQLRLLNYYQQKGQIAAALHLAEALQRSEPGNQRYQEYFAELMLVELRRSYDDPAELARRAREAAKQFPFLKAHDRYTDIMLRQRALLIRDLFAAGRETEGLTQIHDFRTLLTDTGNGNDRPLWTLTAFVAASNYYFAKKDYAPARAYIEEALRYDPANDFLLHQQDLLSRY